MAKAKITKVHQYGVYIKVNTFLGSDFFYYYQGFVYATDEKSAYKKALTEYPLTNCDFGDPISYYLSYEK